MALLVLRRIYNPRNRTCGCSPECWCQRTTLGRMFRWWFPGHLFGMPHRDPYSALERRGSGATRVAKSRIVGFDPIFVVSDVASAVTHYELLGFEISNYDAGYAFAQRDNLTLHLAGADEAETPGGGSLYLHVNDADTLADEWRAVEIEFVEPQDKEWGKYEGSHRDSDGNLIRFGSERRG